ncbi:MAG: ABC transporter permease [Dactylosporangium sp.]|nr:ABC transporter permease [Dactylosporangium sp.]
MSPTLTAARAGLARGWIELRHTFTNGQDLWNYLFFPVCLLIVMFLMRDATVPGTSFSLGARTLPSVLGMGVAFNGLATTAAVLLTEREDGTLLRAKAIPGGMLGYLIGKVVLVSGMQLVSFAIVLTPGLMLFDGLSVGSPEAWLTLAGVLVLGMLATLPLGAVIGSLFDSPRNMGLVMLPFTALTGISGVFYPITSFPGWLQALAQVFPLYWLGLGMRSALLPAELAAAEIGHSWHHLETVAVLGVWAVAGFILAPVVLRRMARRESGSAVAARREKAMRRAV